MWKRRMFVLSMLLYLFQTTYVVDVSSLICTITVGLIETIILIGLSYCI